jgi:hypothetical protein
LKHNKAWLDDECLELIDQWKQAKLQQLKIQGTSVEITAKFKM